MMSIITTHLKFKHLKIFSKITCRPLIQHEILHLWKFYAKSPRLEKQKRSFSRFNAKLGNEIPQRIRALPTKAYKGEILGILFKKY